MGIDFALQRAQLCLICHLTQLFRPRNLKLGGDNLRQADGHLLQRGGDLMRVAVINFQRARHDAFLPQRNHQHGVDFRRSVGFIIVFNNDFTVVNRLSGGWADGVIIIAIVVLPDANVGQHVVNIGDGDSVSVDVMANDFADLTQRLRVNVAEER